MKLNKKGEAFTQLIWILRIIFWIIVIITCYGIIYYFIDADFQPWEAEADTFAMRMLYSPNGISYFDPLAGKIQPGVVDLLQFDRQIWNKSIYYGEDQLAAKMILKNLERNEIATSYYNEDLFKRWETPNEGIAKFSKKYYVLIRKARKDYRIGTFEGGFLEFEILIRK